MPYVLFGILCVLFIVCVLLVVYHPFVTLPIMLFVIFLLSYFYEKK